MMIKHNLQALSILKPNQKFEWNNKTYTVYSQEARMVEVFDGKRFWAWPSWTKVIPITFKV